MIYENVKSICELRGLTIRGLEKKAGLTNGTIGKWRTCHPRSDNLEKVAKALGVSVTRLLRRET